MDLEDLVALEGLMGHGDPDVSALLVAHAYLEALEVVLVLLEVLVIR